MAHRAAGVPAEAQAPHLSHWRLALLVALGAFAVYFGSFRAIHSIDGTTNVLLAYSLLEGDAYLDEFDGDRDRLSYWSFRVGDHLVSPYPPGAALLAVPFAAAGRAFGIGPSEVAAVTVVGHIAAGAATAASVGVVFVIAARLAGARRAVIVASLYAFGTATWPVSGVSLWQHGPAQLCLALGLLALVPGPTGPRAGLAGVAFGLATLARISDGLFLAAAGLALLLAYGRGPALRYALGAALPLAALAAYLTALFGSPFDTSYAAYNFRSEREPLLGLVGNLVSPGRGLLIYSPFLAVALVALAKRALARDAFAVILRAQLLAAAGILVLYASSVDWWAGYGYGNRYLADTLPLLAVGLALWLREPHARATWIAFAVASAWAMALSLVGALFYDWIDWSWEGTARGSELAWRLDPPPWLYALGIARWDAVTLASLLFIAAGAAAFVRAYALARRMPDGVVPRPA